MRKGEWTEEKTRCPYCGSERAVNKYREVSGTMYIPRSWGEDEEYENWSGTDWAFECYDCGEQDGEAATY